MQPAKPSFLEYFEQKEKEANSHNDGGRGENNADNRKLPAEEDLQVVSWKLWGGGVHSEQTCQQLIFSSLPGLPSF